MDADAAFDDANEHENRMHRIRVRAGLLDPPDADLVWLLEQYDIAVNGQYRGQGAVPKLDLIKAVLRGSTVHGVERITPRR